MASHDVDGQLFTLILCNRGENLVFSGNLLGINVGYSVTHLQAGQVSWGVGTDSFHRWGELFQRRDKQGCAKGQPSSENEIAQKKVEAWPCRHNQGSFGERLVAEGSLLVLRRDCLARVISKHLDVSPQRDGRDNIFGFTDLTTK